MHLQKKNNLKIIWTVTNQAYREYQFVDCSPYDFIALLDKAKFAFVKSFHGTAMSLILNKPFLSFDIVHQNNSNIWDPRLIGLSKKLGFSNKVFDWNNIVFESFDWASINDAISLEATKSYNYFADILKLLDEETKQH